MSSKENLPPAQARKSKIPVPKLQPVSAAGKGKKRAVSPSASTNDCKRSPLSSKKSLAKQYEKTVSKKVGQRKTLGELPCEQRKIVKVRRVLNDDSSMDVKGTKRTARGKIANGKSIMETRSTKTEVFGIDRACLPDQSGILFEKDDFALQSILDETGIQFQQPQTGISLAQSKVTRHTLAAIPKPQRESTAPSRTKACVDNFRKACDDFITQASSRQPKPKRQCTDANFRNDDSLNLKLTPSKTDFCFKYGVEKSVTFQGVTPGLTARQSLPGRTRERPPDLFSAPGRCSMVAQTPRRLAKVGEEVEPGQNILAAQTPQRVLKKVKEVTDSHHAVEDNLMAYRQNGQPQTPGRVSLSALTPGRQSLAPAFFDRFSFSALTPGRPSLTAQPPGRVSLYEKNGTKINAGVLTAGRMSLSVQPPGRISLAALKPSQQVHHIDMNPDQGRLSLAAQGPGRVSLSAQKPKLNPGQGRIQQTPGRVPKKEKIEEKKNDNDMKTNGPESVSEMPVKDKSVPLCATPIRVKLLQADEQTPKSTPQRILKSVVTPQHTPRRVLVTGSLTPKQNTNTPQQPQRLPLKVATPVTPSRVLLQEVSSKKTPGQETPNKKTPSKSRLGEGVDIRTFWKTKKTPSKSPILKEVLTKESNAEVSTPKSCYSSMLPGTLGSTIKRKKTLTWADALERCQSPESRVSAVKIEDERWELQEVKTQSSHDAMQDNPHQEKSTSSSAKDTHVTTLTDTQNSLDNMQLPVCLTGSGPAYSATTSGSIHVENKPQGDDPCSKADDTLVSHPPTFAQLETDSLLVSQRELGQHQSNVLANTTQNEFLQKQIELFEEKKRQLNQLQMQIQQQLFKASDPGPVSLEHELDNAALAQNSTPGQIQNGNTSAGFSDDNLMEQVKLDNHHFGKNLNVSNLDFKYSSNTSTQGIFVSGQINLDLNSNVTGSENTYDKSLTEVESQSSPFLHSADTFSGIQEAHIFCTPTQQRNSSYVEDDITPYILKTKTKSDQTEAVGENNEREQEFEKVQLSVKGSVGKEAVRKTESISVPLWTPLAMKTVAKQQTVDKINEEHQSAETVQSIDSSYSENNKSVCNPKTECKPKIDFEAKSEIDTCVTNSESAVCKSDGLVPNEKAKNVEERESVSEQCQKTPLKKKSAFWSVGGSGLTPVVGSLSLRANTATNHEPSGMPRSHSLHSSVLRIANERYLEALLDDEVALYMCRLSPGSTSRRGRDLCCDPVAKVLLHGDDMHFIPIEMDYSQTTSAHIEGSAFTKYSVRAT